jgi:hypothetical protein
MDRKILEISSTRILFQKFGLSWKLEDLPQRAALLLDKAPSNPRENVLTYDNCLIIVKFLLPNVTAVMKSMNQGVTVSMKWCHWTDLRNLASIAKLKLSHYMTQRCLVGEEVWLLLILDLDTRWGEWSASCPGCALAPGKGPLIPTVQEAGLAPELVWTQRLEEKSFSLCWESNLDFPVVQPILLI